MLLIALPGRQQFAHMLHLLLPIRRDMANINRLILTLITAATIVLCDAVDLHQLQGIIPGMW
jgi:hypothetical protein